MEQQVAEVFASLRMTAGGNPRVLVDLRAENAYCGVPFRDPSCAEIFGGHRPPLQRLKEAHLVL
jgi:hypothetical protein